MRGYGIGYTVIAKWREASAKAPASVRVSEGKEEDDEADHAAEEDPADDFTLLGGVSVLTTKQL